MSDKPLTGRKVLIIAVSFFAVIIAVNVTMAVQAIGTFPGLETKNSYVVSQTFDEDRAAQEALGWDVTLDYARGSLRLEITDPEGRPVQPEMLETTLGRATHVQDDITPVFVFDGRAYVAPADLEPGNWDLRMKARADDGTEFRRRVKLYVRDSA